MQRIFVEKKPSFATEARHLLADLRESLNLKSLEALRIVQRYEADGLTAGEFDAAVRLVLSEPQVDTTSRELSRSGDEHAFAVEYLPGQFDQRADSAAQCIQILTGKERPLVISAKVILLQGALSEDDIDRIKSYVINAVDSHEVDVDADSIRATPCAPADVEILSDFNTASPAGIRRKFGLAMSEEDVAFCQNYFGKEENRAPSITELKMLDTYWSDHCRHTTFLTKIDEVTFDEGTEPIQRAWKTYLATREHLGRQEKPVTLMDIALMGMRELRASGELDNLEESEEINAASIIVPVEITPSLDRASSIPHLLIDESLASIPEKLARQAREFREAACDTGDGCGADRIGKTPASGIAEWAEREGKLISSEALDGLGIPVSNHTSEHEVFFDEDRQRAVKRTWPGVFGQIPSRSENEESIQRVNAKPADYLLRMALQIAIFGDDTKLEGISVSNEPSMIIGEPAGQPSLIVSQAWIEASDPEHPHPTFPEIATFMESKGFSPVNDSFFGWTRTDGVTVIDAKPDNFILTSNGVVPIDLQLALLPSSATAEEWLIQFKNETHNHPTEIEPFGGAATCLGGCIRDPLSGRSYVYQAMRVTGAADPRTPFSETLPGKLPQKKICQIAAKGYSSYGNQIGLATGQVAEVYHPGYVAKRMEIGAVVAAAPRSNVFRGSPANGDLILLIGGRTGRDGVGGATGSSKEHTDTALENSAEVQKGDAPTERKIQRLFRNAELARKIKICNDFGAGGVSVAIGEIAPSLDIDLDAVPKKYNGLDGTELAISESQERMAVCVDPADAAYFIAESDKENLECVHVATVRDHGRLRMTWRGKEIVNLSRAFLDTNGVQLSAKIHVAAPTSSPPSYGSLLTDHLALLNHASQKGLGEMFDGSVGAGTVLWPFGGEKQLTPPDAMVAKLPLLEGDTDVCTYMSWAFNPELSSDSPFHGAASAVAESACKIVAAGARLSDIRLTLQEYFPKLGDAPGRWGLPFAALLGAFDAQHGLRLAAIGGKDSMSGSFNDLDVPPTLVSFALAPGKASQALSPEFKQVGSTVSLVDIPPTSENLPDYDRIKEVSEAIHTLAVEGKLLSCKSIGHGGLAHAIPVCCFGNHCGMTVPVMNQKELYQPRPYSFLIEHEEALPASLNAQNLGQVTEQPTLTINGETYQLADLQSAWTSTHEPIFPTKSPTQDLVEAVVRSPKASTIHHPSSSIAKPKVLIPSFPGTNSEYDSAKAFREAGAEAHIEVFRNLTPAHLKESLKTLAAQIRESQILFLPGGFSAGDEPDGSAKFIATVLRNPEVADAVMDLLKNRDGLILGICNGFQALIKTGLVPYGEILDGGWEMEDDGSQMADQNAAGVPSPSTIHHPPSTITRHAPAQRPTLFHNDISRHISCYAPTVVTSTLSPWLSNSQVGDIHRVPFSHGEGKFVASPEVIAELAASGQIATRYCDPSGQPSMDIAHNPNGSIAAIEGITSPCGRVLGKMGHTERHGTHVAKNIPGEKHQPLFKAGVAWFS